jgi:hypothetical protein
VAVWKTATETWLALSGVEFPLLPLAIEVIEMVAL